jgi:hypothetical protein
MRMQRAFPGAHRVESRMDPQLTSQIVPAEEIKVIEECLVRLAEDTGGNYVLLLDKSGQVITAQETPHARILPPWVR